MTKPRLSNSPTQIVFKKRIILIVTFIVLSLGIFLSIGAFQPERTVANFCKVAIEEKATLVGNVNYEMRLEAYKKLEAVSPEDIHPDIKTIRRGYEEIIQNPSTSLSSGIGMSGSENRRTTYIEQNCKDF